MSCTVLKTKMKEPKGPLDDARDLVELSWLRARSFFFSVAAASYNAKKKTEQKRKNPPFR
jgi:hypothetical protein